MGAPAPKSPPERAESAGIPFAKMSGAGNTFVLIDNRAGVVDGALAAAGLSLDGFVIRVCSPLHGVGADGLILIEPSEAHDFAWRFFNADGSRADMCGNGARCAARFARGLGAVGETAEFETGAGVVRAEFLEGGAGDVRVRLTPPGPVHPEVAFDLDGRRYLGHFVDTGVPHVVIPVPSVADVDVAALGARVRNDPRFAPAGTNVDFVARGDDGTLRVRTYERGVEGETMACGTGVAAAVVVMVHQGDVRPPVRVVPLSGEALTVDLDVGDGALRAVSVAGPARVLLTGEIAPEALR